MTVFELADSLEATDGDGAGELHEQRPQLLYEGVQGIAAFAVALRLPRSGKGIGVLKLSFENANEGEARTSLSRRPEGSPDQRRNRRRAHQVGQVFP